MYASYWLGFQSASLEQSMYFPLSLRNQDCRKLVSFSCYLVSSWLQGKTKSKFAKRLNEKKQWFQKNCKTYLDSLLIFDLISTYSFTGRGKLMITFRFKYFQNWGCIHCSQGIRYCLRNNSGCVPWFRSWSWKQIIFFYFVNVLNNQLTLITMVLFIFKSDRSSLLIKKSAFLEN